MSFRSGDLGSTDAPTSQVTSGRSASRPKPYPVKTVASRCADKMAPCDDTAETEGERQLKRLLNQQLDKNITLEMQFERHRDFQASASYESFPDKLSGQLSSREFSAIKTHKQRVDRLRQLGLDDNEVRLKLRNDGLNQSARGRLQKEPGALIQQLDVIQDKIDRKESELSQSSAFREAKQLTRHEMDLERSLKPNSSRAQLYSNLVTAKRVLGDQPHPDDPCNRLQEMERELSRRVELATSRTGCRRRETSSPEPPPPPSPTSARTDDDKICGDEPSHTVFTEPVAPVPEVVIISGRLSAEEIQGMSRFENHRIGTPSNTLFLKNLAPGVHERDLIALFSRFQSPDGSDPIRFRLMSGRMKGQAFATFSDTHTAEQALHLVHGFVWKGRPIVIQFGRASTEQRTEQ